VKDLVPIALATRMPRRKLTRTQIHLRWVAKNRDKWNAYRREWWARRKQQQEAA
jgi:hypothetical protein